MTSPAFAASVSLDFDCISHNSGRSCATGEQQLHAQLESTSLDTATFRFTNLGHGQSVITQIYWDDAEGLLKSMIALNRRGRVAFEASAKPVNLPGGNAPQFDFRADFSLGAQRPAPQFGIDNGLGCDLETLAVTFALGGDFAAVRNALANGKLRLGLHVQGFHGGFSESFINQPPVVVPLPETVWLLGSGLIGIAAIGRRRHRGPSPDSGAANNLRATQNR